MMVPQLSTHISAASGTQPLAYFPCAPGVSGETSGAHGQTGVGQLGSGPVPAVRHTGAGLGLGLAGSLSSPPGRRHLLPNKVLSPVLEQLLTDPGGCGRRRWGQCWNRSPLPPHTGP